MATQVPDSPFDVEEDNVQQALALYEQELVDGDGEVDPTIGEALLMRMPKRWSDLMDGMVATRKRLGF